ncbi:hypothetical protein Hanom_Chr06g00536391 [Helianthus anomalus]
MLTISGLRDEYHVSKSNLLTRHPPVTFNELHGLLADHDYMINKPQSNIIVPTPQTSQVFATTTGNPSTLQPQLNSLKQLASQLGYQLNPITPPNSQPRAFYAARPPNTRGNRRGNSRGAYRGNYNNWGRDNTHIGPTRQFAWASTQNMVIIVV